MNTIKVYWRNMIAIPISFQYSIESEVQRVKDTLENSEWFKKNNYRLLLPADIQSDSDTQSEDIKKAIKDGYDLSSYRVAENAILKSWEGNSGFVRKINEKMTGSDPLEEIRVILTKYGTQGSYGVPNSMIINISNVPPEFLIKTVIHESIHLMIEHLVKEYSIEHWVKERLVNLVMDLEYKSRFKMQSAPDWAIAADEVFNEYYPNMLLIAEKVSKIKAPAHSVENVQGLHD